MSEMSDDIRQAIREIVPETIAEGVAYFQKAIANKDVIASADLQNDIDFILIEESDGLMGSINFHEYGRYRDMKTLRWAGKAPPIEELEAWVKLKGVSSFAWIPGYEASGRVPTESIAIRRLASAISKSMGSVQVTHRKFKGTWYNETKMRMVNVTRARVLARITDLIAKRAAEEATIVVEI
jgi:hypothetical protein